MVAERVLVTGATGFIGRGLVRELQARGRQVLGTVRSAEGSRAGVLNLGELGPETDWSRALQGVTTVVHLAGRAHILRESAADPLAAYRRVNVAGSGHLARSAAAAGVKRLIFLSSIGVHGNTSGGTPLRETDPVRPHNDYARSKWEAEQLLQEVGRERGLEIVIVRPPLVYGPGVKANFLALLEKVARGAVLPLGRVTNQRSLLALDNLVDFLILATDHPAAGGTYLLADGEDVSTPELIRRLAALLGRPARLLPVPLGMLRLAALLTGRRATLEKICGSLQVDSSKARRELGWQPVLGLQAGLEKTVRWYLENGQF